MEPLLGHLGQFPKLADSIPLGHCLGTPTLHLLTVTPKGGELLIEVGRSKTNSGGV